MEFSSDVHFGHVSVWVASGFGHHIVVEGVGIASTGISLKIGTVPSGELTLDLLSLGGHDIALSVVGPDLTDVQVLDEDNWVATPELLSWDQTTWGNDATSGELSTLLDARAFENDGLFTDHDIILNVARVESGSCSDRAVLANDTVCRHASWESSGSVDNTVIANGSEASNRNPVNIASHDTVVPDGGPLVDSDFSDNSCVWCDPVVIKSWHQVVQWKSDSVLGLLVDHGELRLLLCLLREATVLAYYDDFGRRLALCNRLGHLLHYYLFNYNQL